MGKRGTDIGRVDPVRITAKERREAAKAIIESGKHPKGCGCETCAYFREMLDDDDAAMVSRHVARKARRG